jgi:predicted metal-dependent hydrolase
MFAHADEVTVRAVARYLTDGHQSASGQLQRFIKAHRDRIRRMQQQELRVHKGGSHHDLPAILTTLNGEYFDDEVDARIGWARMGRALGRRGRRRSIKLGSYRSRDALIRVHPVLDSTWVPDFFVHYIVYHEMVHHVVAMPVENGRRCLHGPEFRAREKQFARYDEAIAWEQANLDRLLSG